MTARTTRSRTVLTLCVLVLVAAPAIGLYVYAGPYAYGMILRGRLSYWTSVPLDDADLPEPMREALAGHAPAVVAGPLAWTRAAEGLDTAELPALANGREVDRFYLTRVDPERFRFVAENAPLGTTDVDQWRRRLGAAVVVNGSYFSRHGYPDTPFLSEGRALGPADYAASQGAFVADDRTASIHDLSKEAWPAAFARARNAMVSYPILVRPDGSDPGIKDSFWLANRTFVGQDRAGRIILGTSASAFFSLKRLSDFLRASTLDLVIALNLDGGPVAGQAVAAGTVERSVCGRWEMQSDGRTTSLLGWTGGCWGLPVVLAAVPKP